MQATNRPLFLADAADVLSAQVRVHLARLSRLILPHMERLDGQFLQSLRRAYDPKQRKALLAVTPGAAARILGTSRPLADFFEQTAYSGRRLAKLGVPPPAVIQSIRDYDAILDPLLANQLPPDHDVFRWARAQLQFATAVSLNGAYAQVREEEAQAFFDLFQAEVECPGLNEMIERFAAVLTRTFRAQAGKLILDQPPGQSWRKWARPRYIESGSIEEEELLLDPGWRGKYCSYWSIPLVDHHRRNGVVQFAFAKRYDWLPRELQLMKAAAGRVLAAAERMRLRQELSLRERQVRRLAGRVIEIEEEERRRISRDLHDEAGQSLLFIRLQLEMLEKAGHPELAEVRAVAERTVSEVRRIIADLSPAVLEQLGLAAAVRQLVVRFRRMYPVTVRLRVAARLGRLAPEIEVIAYRLVQESLNNIAKHSQASHVNLSLGSTDKCVELRIEDDGVGFDVEAAMGQKESFGLVGMMERVELMGGHLRLRSDPGMGTAIQIQLPVQSRRETSNGEDPHSSYR